MESNKLINEDSAFGPGMMFGITGPGPKKDTKGIPSDPEMEKGIEVGNKKKKYKMKNLQSFEEFINESINEADMTKFYDGFVMYDHKNKKEYKSRYQKGVKNNILEDLIAQKIAKEYNSTESSIAVNRFIKKGEWDKVELEIPEIKLR